MLDTALNKSLAKKGLPIRSILISPWVEKYCLKGCYVTNNLRQEYWPLLAGLLPHTERVEDRIYPRATEAYVFAETGMINVTIYLGSKVKTYGLESGRSKVSVNPTWLTEDSLKVSFSVPVINDFEQQLRAVGSKWKELTQSSN